MNVSLVRLRKNGSPQVFPLGGVSTIIGRRRNCDLRIPVMSVSRKHCQVDIDDGALKIRDLGSHNGTYLNGKRIDETAGQAGNFLKIGPVTFVLQIDGKPEVSAPPAQVAQSTPQQDAPKQDAIKQDAPKDDFADEQFADFADLEDLASLEETDSA